MSKSFPEKMKNFFRRTESYTYNFDGLQVETFNVTLEMLKAISNESSTGHRLRTLKEIQEYVLTKKLADNAVEAIYSRIQDLVSPQQSIEIRHETFNFYIALIKGQVEYMQIMRTILFRDILRHTVPEDIVPRFGMLKALTDDGRNVLNFEIEMGYFLMRDFFDFMTPDLSVEFLKLVITFIKFNAAYVDEAVIVGFMAYLKEVCFNSPTVEVAQECLNLMEAILCYSHLPESELDIFLYILCVTVNTEALAESSWKQMRNILGTYKGVFGISSLCNMLKEMKAKQSILRGAVYFLGMALWGVNGVSALQIPPSAVLPSFAKVLETRSFVIAREVVLALTRLVVNREDLLDGRSLFWDSIFYIAEKIQNFPEFQNLSHPLDICVKELNDFLIACENKCRYEMFDSLKHLSVLLDNYSALRSDQSMIRLVSFRAESLTASKPHFILRLNNYLEKYLKTEKRTPVLLEVLRNLKEIRLMNLRVTDEDLMDQVILQNLVNSDTFTDVVVRKTVVEFLIVLADSITSSLFLDVLDIMGKIMKRMLDNLKASENEDPKDTYIDAIAAVEGLIHVFKRKLFMMPPNHCVEIFHLFVKHMQQHYLCPSYAEDAVKVRKMILEFFFEIRANKYKHVGVLKGSGSGHSVYLMCDSSPSRDEMVPSSPPPQSPSAMGPVIAHLGFDKGFQVIISCLKEEKDWRLLEMALKEIPILLQNKSLILNSNCSVGTLCSTMCQMVSGRNNIVETLRHGPLKFTRTELNGYIFPCAMTFTSYHSNLDSHIQRLLIRSLLSGLVSRSARNCIEGLTLCLLEMKNSMNKLLPDVLLQLSKISATKMVALPVLEFLSNLIRLPELYKSFVEDQYMSIFAIALPYTNPYKFNQYTVALAHHVLSMWYLKCRIPFRRDFAKFIMKGLRSNIDIPRSECKNTSNQSLDQGAKARDEKNFNLGQSSRSTQNSPREDNVTEERTDQTILELHTELMETGLDLMTRFTFGMCSNQPERSPIDEFLLEKGQKTSWVVGNKIITITTSGAGSKTFKNGLCEVCYKATHEEADKTDEIDPDPLDPDLSEDPKPQSFQLKKKRHRSAIQRRNTAYSEEISINTSKTKDDIMLHYSSSPDSSAFARRHTSYVPDTDRFSSISHGSDKQDKSHPLCSCWVTSWAEVHIRRPTGNTSWMTRMQNKLTLPSQSDVPLSILNSLVLPQLEQELEICGDSPSESDAISLLESELTEELACEGAIDITSKPKTTPPMRRTNSSPDMNTGWMSNLESKQSLLESSTELEKEEDESKLEVPSSVQPSALKQRVPDKSKSKNLKLDFAPLSHGHSSSKESGPTSVKETVRASSIGQRQLSNEAQPQPSTVPFRDRGHTISVMSPNRPTGADNSTKTSEANPRNGMSPSFVFLQLFQDSVFGITYPKPLLIPHSEANNRSLSLLDHIPPYDCHKIGVVYIGPDQAEDEVAILSNVGGSSRYVAFLRGLGRMVRLRKTDPHTTYLGGLDTKRGEDGDYALIWHDDVMQVVFHEATLMKNRPSDKNRNEKKKHIANDCVMIAYNDSKADFNISTIKGQVTNACIVVRPEDFNCNVVTVSYRIPEMKESFGHTGSYLVSDESLAVFVRQMALHANLASVLISRKLQGTKYAQVSNWLERLRSIKRLRSKMEDDWNAKNADNYAFETEPSDYTDFTDYV